MTRMLHSRTEGIFDLFVVLYHCNDPETWLYPPGESSKQLSETSVSDTMLLDYTIKAGSLATSLAS